MFSLVREIAKPTTSLPIVDTTALVHDQTASTKRVRIDAGTVTPGATRAIIMKDADATWPP